MDHLILLIIVLLTLLETAGTENWCLMVGCLEKHVACNDNWARHVQCPPDARPIDFNKTKNQVLKAYNDVRNEVASGKYQELPSAVRMAEMQWDDDLAWLASLNTRKCRQRCDMCRNTNKFLRAAQKMASTRELGNTLGDPNDSLRVQRILDYWLAEGNDIRHSDIQAYTFHSSQPIIAHFAIAVMEMNSHVGCAGNVYLREGYTRYRLTCNFATGPEIDYPIYREGEPGSKCKTGKSATYPFLCSTAEVYKNDELFTHRTMD